MTSYKTDPFFCQGGRPMREKPQQYLWQQIGSSKPRLTDWLTVSYNMTLTLNLTMTSILKMEEARSSETLVFKHHTTRRNNPKTNDVFYGWEVARFWPTVCSCELNWSIDSQPKTKGCSDVRGCIQKFPDWVDNEINNNSNKHPLRSNTKGYGGKTH
jgi:hypothetical protein